jgi:diguanylate cyclase (GGDEF)-like protein/PAS domain S-box-containing protein
MLENLKTGTESLCVMVVDDDPLAVKVVAQLLRPLACQVLTACSGEEAVELFNRQRPDIIYMDVQMEGMDGIEATRRIKALAGEQWVPLVIISGEGDTKAVAECLNAGADDFYRKPINSTFFHAKFRTLYRALSMQRSLVTMSEQLKQSQERYRNLFLRAPIGYLVIDTNGLIVESNRALQALLGYAPDQLKGRRWIDLLDREDRDKAFASANILQVEGETVSPPIQTRNLVTGATIYMEVHALLDQNEQGETQIHCNIIDLTERVLAEAETARLLEKLSIARDVFEHTRDSIFVTDAKLNFIDVNPAFTAATGYEREDLLGQNALLRNEGLTPESVYQDMVQTLKQQDFWRGEVISRYKDGSLAADSMTISGVRNKDTHKVVYYVCVIDQINSQRTDFTTSLPRRSALQQHVINLGHNGGAPETGALILLGIDGFKEINTALGIRGGDVLLREFGKRIKDILPKEGFAARTGGDEFGIVLRGASDRETAYSFMDQLLERCRHSVSIGGETVYPKVSAGMALFPDDANDFENLMQSADEAMQSAKRIGGNRWEAFRTSRKNEVLAFKHLLDDLRAALENDEFFLAYQPIFDLRSGRLLKAEALLRWNHPERGLVNPGDFISAAERSGTILEIGQWVFQKASKDLRLLLEIEPQFQLSINFSVKQIFDTKFDTDTYTQLLLDVNIPPSHIVLEFTEGVMLTEEKVIADRLHALRAAGFEIAIDDFGTGYSSLSYVDRFNFNYLKIDQSFVRAPRSDSKKQALCRAIVSMGHALDMKIIAEGIETEAQQALLEGIGCDYGQGYFLGRPMPLDALKALMKKP